MAGWRELEDGFFDYVETRRKAGLYSPTRFLATVGGVTELVVYDTMRRTRKPWKLGHVSGPACERPSHWRVLPQPHIGDDDEG